MFKSVFSRYIAAFLLIFLLSFTLMTVIVTDSITDYSTDQREKSAYNAAYSAKLMLDEAYSEYISTHFRGKFDGFIEEESDALSNSLSAIARYSEMTIFVTNQSGRAIVVDNDTGKIGGNVDKSILSDIFAGGVYRSEGDLGGVLEGSFVICGMNLAMGKSAAAVFVCASSSERDVFVLQTVETMITASMIVMVCGLIAIYFICRRIVRPIRDMSEAAKDFASGHFERRVTVSGKDEVAGLAVAFNQMAEDLQEMENLRNSFLANVSHDLRTPMTTISGFIDGILDGIIPPEKYDYYLGIIASEVKRLSRLVATLLDISRIQAGDRKFTMAPFDFCEVARQALLSQESRIDKKKLDVEFDAEEDNLYVIGDSDAIHQVVYNLIDNAIKFSYDGGALKIKLFCEKSRVYISVYNEGVGMSDEDIKHVFDRFYKADKSRGLDKTGVGLGLYICKAIAEAHGSTIKVFSEQGKWCRFEFSLEATAAPDRRKQSLSKTKTD